MVSFFSDQVCEIEVKDNGPNQQWAMSMEPVIARDGPVRLKALLQLLWYFVFLFMFESEMKTISNRMVKTIFRGNGNVHYHLSLAIVLLFFLVE